MLVHGEERLVNNTQLRRIHNNYNDLVVFWTIVDTRAVLSQDVRPQIWELAQKMDVYWETGVFPGTSNTVAGDQSQSSVGVHRPMTSQDASTGVGGVILWQMPLLTSCRLKTRKSPSQELSSMIF